MGYYTYYNLSLEDVYDPKIEDGVRAKLHELEVIGYALSEDLGGYDSVKWYDHDEDMLEVSRAFPDVHFVLHGEGDNTEDIWETHCLGGKMATYMAEIRIPPFNPEDLR